MASAPVIDAGSASTTGQSSGNLLFAHMPVEMLVMIARPLSTPEFCAFRLSCRSVEQALFPSFRHEFFRKKQFMIEDNSLRALLEISRSKRLAPVLEHVIFGFDHCRAINRLDRRYQVNLNAQERRELTQLRRLGYAQFSLFYSGRAINMLADAFHNLACYGNPKTVDLRDFESRTRWRDGPNHVWHSYGSQTIDGMSLSLSTSDGQRRDNATFVSGVFIMVLRALAMAEAAPVSLEVLCKNQYIGLADFAFDVKEAEHDSFYQPKRVGQMRVDRTRDDGTRAPSSLDRELPSVSNVLHGLEKLHLDVDLQCDCYEGKSNYISQTRFIDWPESICLMVMNLHDFIMAAQNVRWLRINFQNTPSIFANAYLEYFGRPIADLDAVVWPDVEDAASPSSAGLSQPRLMSTAPAHLERLDFGRARLSPVMLINAIKRIPTLKTLHLHRIELVRESGEESKENMWAWFLKEVAAAARPAEYGGSHEAPVLEKLWEFSVVYASQQGRGSQFDENFVTFHGKTRAEYKGSRLGEYLWELSGGVEIVPNRTAAISNDSDESEGEGSVIDFLVLD